MAKLNQIIAVATGTKGRAQKALTAVHHKLQKAQLLSGISRAYRPKDEDGESLPAESTEVQYSVHEAIKDATLALTGLFDVVATLDRANCLAAADVKVKGVLVLSAVPVTTLIFLEKQLVDLHTLIEKLPTLDVSESWELNPSSSFWSTRMHETTRTKKLPKAFVKYEATKEHPAQVDLVAEDVIVGYWETVKFSGAIPEAHKMALITRVQSLLDAVKYAREEANSIDVQDTKIGSEVLEFIFTEE